MSVGMDLVSLECQYNLARVEKECRLRQAAARYELEFERAFARREQRRRESKRQWLEIILPAIKREAELRAYEKSLEVEYV